MKHIFKIQNSKFKNQNKSKVPNSKMLGNQKSLGILKLVIEIYLGFGILRFGFF